MQQNQKAVSIGFSFYMDMDKAKYTLYFTIYLTLNFCSPQIIVEDFVTDTCTSWPSTNNLDDAEVHMVKGKYYISSGKGNFEEDKCTNAGHWPAKIRNADDYGAFTEARKGSDKDYYLHLKLTANARDNCQQVGQCNGSFAHRDDNSAMYLYDWMFGSAKVDTAKGCAKFKSDSKIETEHCDSDKRHFCLVKCIPEWPNCVIKELDNYRYDANSHGIVSRIAGTAARCANLCLGNPNCIFWTRKWDSSCKLIPLSAMQPWLANTPDDGYHERSTKYCIPPITCADAPIVANARITNNDTNNQIFT